MAISSATMTVTITEAVTLNGAARGNTNTLTLSNIHEVTERTVTVPTAEVELIAMGTAVSSGTFIEGDVRYIRITNKDATNHVGLIFKNEDNDEFGVKLDKGQSFIYNGDLAGGVVDTMEAAATAIGTNTFADLVNITAIADTAACDVEFMVACV
tara:strand:+ start:95 stop:559 length:465 start_codon:yes stop_codon:yes gene_type:complete